MADWSSLAIRAPVPLIASALAGSTLYAVAGVLPGLAWWRLLIAS